jgi:hypothetical protein
VLHTAASGFRHPDYQVDCAYVPADKKSWGQIKTMYR